VVRLALPLLCCAALLWGRSGVEAEHRATCGAPAVVAEEPVTAAAVDSESPSSSTGPCGPDAVPQTGDPPPPGEPLPSDPAELRQHDVRDLVALGYSVDQIASWLEWEGTATRVTVRVNVLEILAPEATQVQLERVLEDTRRNGKRVLQFYEVTDLVCATQEIRMLRARTVEDDARSRDAADADAEVEAARFDTDSLVELIEATIGEGSACVQPKDRWLVVRATPRVQAWIARILDDLRSGTAQGR